MERDTLDRGDFDDLTRRVLEQTSGSACPGAHERLAPLADGMLPPGDDALVRMHLTHCQECARVLEAVTWLTKVLPTLAEAEPDAAFTRDVMAVTAQVRSPFASWTAWIGRARDAARAMLARPRLPLEGAYIGAVVVWLLFGTSFSPLRDVPGQAARLARINPAAVAQAAVVPIPRFLSNPADSARALLSPEDPPTAQPERLTWGDRLDRAGDRALSLGRHGLRMTGETFKGNFREGGDHFRLMGDDAKAIWIILGAPDPPVEPARPRPTTTAPQRTLEKEA